MKKIMWNLKYYFKRLKNMDHKGFFDAIDVAHAKSGKFRIFLFFDMVWSSWRYTAGYVDYNEFEFYSINGKQRKTYLTLGQSHKVEKAYNDAKYSGIFDDKSIFVDRFVEYVSRDHIDLRKVSADDFCKFVRDHKKVMAKKTSDYVGRGIDKIDLTTTPNLDLCKLYHELKDSDQVLIEEFFKQHPKMDELSDKSVNTLRIITFLDDQKIPRVLVRVLKSGLGKHLDNIGQGGMYTILDENGVVKYPFLDQCGNQHTINPLNGRPLIGFQVPNYPVIEQQIKEACLKVQQVRYIGWDVAVTPEGNAEIIEGNTSTGPFQLAPSMCERKEGCKPIYQKYMNIQL
ncbi:sugar-transfer associated ATP-grasp domain-containing protein [Erysipelothrix urinaevulpis]|uniref:sugar-transfer associated ATP-grasp domain-containing protein n=1 Tax=Erysipelothrix urinaevulpis TaxID=2683717 RepID=UPI001357ACA1|nr:sugar-transfer associated ATP-grasp domain-containing protein [Erysipelothrix urinaevulpis]